MTTDIDLVFAAHNEGATIGATLTEFSTVLRNEHGLNLRLVVAEDGSSDDTREQVQKLASSLPILLLEESPRKGYSRAVIDGMLATSANLVAFCDSDGQYDPVDFLKLLEALGENDLVIGYRNPRADPFYRKAMSESFKMAFQLLFPVRLKDPSCPYLLIRRAALEKLLVGDVGTLRQGFWWEFNARAVAAGLSVAQIPVRHRARSGGTTQVYLLRKIPGIAFEHLRALFTLRKELTSSK